jgi:hypothetical protein
LHGSLRTRSYASGRLLRARVRCRRRSPRVVDNHYRRDRGKGVNTYLILKQLRVHDSRTAFRELTDVATKEDRLTGFQRLVQNDQHPSGCNSGMKYTFTTAFFRFSISVLTSRYLLAGTTTNDFLTNRGQVFHPRHCRVCLLYTASSRGCGGH